MKGIKMKKENYEKIRDIVHEKEYLTYMWDYFKKAIAQQYLRIGTTKSRILVFEKNYFKFGDSGIKVNDRVHKKLTDYLTKQGKIILNDIKNIIDEEQEQMTKELTKL